MALARIGPKLAVSTTVLLLGIAGFIGYFEHVYAQLAHALERDLSAARSTRWERPVLRAAMGDGNAADEIHNTLAELQPLTAAARWDLGLKVYFGQPLDAPQQAELTRRTPLLHTLRAAAQQRWSHTDLAPELGAQMLVPNYDKLLDAALGLLAEAQTRPPEACLQEAADVIRLGQDVVSSAPLAAVRVEARVITLAARVLTRCALRADLPVLRKTTHELHVLATHPAPTDTALELEALARVSELREQAALSDKNPVQVVQTLFDRPQLLAAWSRAGTRADRHPLDPGHYPEALEEWRRDQDYKIRGSATSAAQVDATLLRLHDDMRGQAVLRMLCVAVAALADRAYRGSLPERPSALRDPALVDPFRGLPLRFRLAANGAEFTLWSTGSDFRDDEGTDDWGDTGPRDVTLHVALR